METGIVIGVVGLALCGLGVLFLRRMRSKGGCSCGGQCGDCPARKFMSESADIRGAISCEKEAC
jgi:hypothetical protein